MEDNAKIRQQDYRDLALVISQTEAAFIDIIPPSEDDESSEGDVLVLGGADTLKTQWVALTLNILTAVLVENAMWAESGDALASYLVRREIRMMTLNRRPVGVAYVEEHSVTSYNIMRRTCGVMWHLLRSVIRANGTHNTDLYHNALSAASTAQALGLTILDLRGNEFYTIGYFMTHPPPS
jgi:hypothetical protein